MSMIDLMYSAKGFYCSVSPLTDIKPATVNEQALGSAKWAAVPANEFHVTVAYDEGASVSQDDITKFFALAGVDEFTTWRAHAIPVVQFWVNKDRLYAGIELYCPELFALKERMQSQLGVKTSFSTYKCHLTYGRLEGLPASELADFVEMRRLGAMLVQAEVPALIELSRIKVYNVE